jgi:mRNA-degrading endonuclease RelE of RelBE toxin-antitoxin system
MAYEIEYDLAARRQLRALDSGPRRRVMDAIERRLRDEAAREDRNRFRRRRPNPLSDWELREGDLRVFYDVDAEGGMVYVRAIGVKRGERTYEPAGPELTTDD